MILSCLKDHPLNLLLETHRIVMTTIYPYLRVLHLLQSVCRPILVSDVNLTAIFRYSSESTTSFRTSTAPTWSTAFLLSNNVYAPTSTSRFPTSYWITAPASIASRFFCSHSTASWLPSLSPNKSSRTTTDVPSTTTWLLPQQNAQRIRRSRSSILHPAPYIPGSPIISLTISTRSIFIFVALQPKSSSSARN